MNPVNDARLMADALVALGFELIGGGAQLDLDGPDLRSAVENFQSRLRQAERADVGLFYYSGFGIQFRGANYLVPVDANPTNADDVGVQMLSADEILRQMEGASANLKMMILDASGDNPFRAVLATDDLGLAQMESPKDTLIALAAQPGSVGRDGAGANSPYTAALARTIRVPGLDIIAAVDEAEVEVMQATGNSQRPWHVFTSVIRGKFYFADRLVPTADPAPPLPPPPVPVSVLDPRVVDFLFATTRTQNKNAAEVTFSGERDTKLNFGAASVRVPEDHKFGRIELPSTWRLLGITIHEGQSNDREHFTIRKVTTLTAAEWSNSIRAKAPKSALIFVHGYNTTFENALYRNAQIVWDMQYPGLSVLFSWASRGELADYYYDRESAYIARSSFIDLLKMLRKEHGIERVDVLAHSMGNLVVIDALSNYAQTRNPARLDELIMAAPDVDRDGFVQMIPRVNLLAKGMTLYASSADRALVASRIPARVPRAGDVPAQGPIILPSMETIDVTAMGDEIFGLNHNVFATTRAIVDDMKILLSTGKRPPNERLAQIRPVPELPAKPKYWRYAP
jgi:esterase/lipase superfamily enzyme